MQVHATTPGARFEVTCGMSGVTSRAGTALLSALADALGLTDALVDGLSVLRGTSIPIRPLSSAVVASRRVLLPCLSRAAGGIPRPRFAFEAAVL